MATLTNVLKTIFTTSGTDRVNQDLNRLTRSTTRLGQSSAGAGRAFSAQSAGLGGLVGAYAGAAATTFALGAAFDALSRSARSVQTLAGVNTLAAGIAQSGTIILNEVQKITKGQLTLVQSAEQVNLALSAGFNTSQITGLSEVALKASRALGRDLTDAMTRVTRGSAKMESELLDELGIYTKIEPATRAYAAAIGKNVSALSEYERRQAFVNAVISEGQRKFSAINTVIPTSAEKIEALGATLSNLATKFGAALADIVAPLAGGIVDNVAASFGTLGLILSLVASKGVSLLSSSMNALVETMKESARTNENYMRARLGLTDAVESATNANKALDTSTTKLTNNERASLDRLKDIAATRQLTTEEINKSNKYLAKSKVLLVAEQVQLKAKVDQEKALTAAAKSKLERAVSINAGAFGTSDFAKRAQAIKVSKQAYEELTPALKEAERALAANEAAVKAHTAAVSANSAAITGWRARLASLGTAFRTPFINLVQTTGTVIGGVANIASKVFFLVSVFQLLGTTIANALGKGDEYNSFFSNVGQIVSKTLSGEDSKKKKEVALGLSSGSLRELEEADAKLAKLENFEFTKKTFAGVSIDVVKTKEDLVTDVTKIINDTEKDIGKGLIDSATSGGALATAFSGALAGALLGPKGAFVGFLGGLALGTYSEMTSSDNEKLIEEFGGRVRTKFSSELAGLSEDAKDHAIRALATLEKKYSEAALLDPAAAAARDVSQNMAIKTLKNYGNIPAISTIAQATALPTAEVAATFTFDNSIEEYLNTAKTTFGKTTLEFPIVDYDSVKLQTILESNILGSFDNISKAISEKLGNAVSGDELKDLTKLVLGDDSVVISTKLIETLTNTNVSVADLQKSLNSVVNINLGNVFSGLINSSSKASDSMLQITNLINSTNKEFTEGTLTLERYSQNMGNIGNSVVTSKRELASLAIAQEAAYDTIANSSSTSQEKQNAKDLLENYSRIGAQLEANLAIQIASLNELKGQEQLMVSQIKLMEFLKKEAKDVSNELEFKKAKAEAGSNNPAMAAVQIIKQEVSRYAKEAEAAKKYRDDISAALEKNTSFDLSSDQIATLMMASSDNMSGVNTIISSVKDGLMDVSDTSIRIGGDIIELVEQTAHKASDIVAMSADALVSYAQEAELAVIEGAKNLRKAVSDLAVDISKQLSELTRTDNVAKIQFALDRNQIRIDAAAATTEFETAFRENQIKIIELKVDNKKMTAVEGAGQITDLVSEIQGIQTSSLEAQRALAVEKFNSEVALLEAERDMSKANIEAEAAAMAAKIKAEYDVIIAAAKVYYEISSKLYSSLVDGGNAVGQAVVNAGNQLSAILAATLNPVLSLMGTSIAAQAQSYTPVAKEEMPAMGTIAVSEFDKAIASANDSLLAATLNISVWKATMLASIDEAFQRDRKLMNLKRAEEIRDFERQKILGMQKEEILKEEAEKRLADAEKADGGGDKKDKLTELEQMLEDLFNSIKGHISSALMSLNNLIFYGEGDLRDIFSNMFKSIQQDFFKTTIADPLSDKLTDTLFGALGVTRTEKGMENARFENGALLVKVAQGPGKLIDSLLGNGDKDKETPTISSTVTGLFSKEGPLATAFSGLFGESGILSNMLTGFGSFLGSLFKAIFGGLFGGGLVTGGPVHMAQGGSASASSIKRDRIPALLEPGEFVIRKPAAKRIGASNLASMNATGNTPSNGAPIINVTNEGSAKDVKSATPKFDGDKFVIDIILRDLSNNGPIRKSLRGGTL